MTRIVLVAVAVLLTGCASAATFDTGRLSTNTSRIDFATIAGGGRDMHTQVFGNPFAIPQDVFADNVTAVLTARNSRSPSNFTSRPGPSARQNFRLVLVFNPARGLPSRLCRDPEAIPTGPASNRPIELQIAFCHGDKDITSRRGSLAEATGPEDPRFQNFLAQALQLTQPRQDQIQSL